MLIKHQLYTTSSSSLVLIIIVMAVTIWGFSQLSEQLVEMTEKAQSGLVAGQKSAAEVSSAADSTQQINKSILTLVDRIKQTNQRTKLVSKKVDEINDSMVDLTELIEEASFEIIDVHAIELLEEISDELANIQEQLRREAQININSSADAIELVSQDIAKQAGKVSDLSNVMKQVEQLTQNASKSSQQLMRQEEAAIDQVQQQQKWVLVMLAVLAVVSIVSAILIINSAIRPISQTVRLMEDVAQGEGDLTQRLDEGGNNEMANIASAFNLFCSKVQSLVISLKETSTQLVQTANTTQRDMQSGHQALGQQLQEIEQIATAINQMTATSQSVAQHAVEAAHATTDANKQIHTGKQTMAEAQHAVGRMDQQTKSAVEVIQELDNKSQDINRVVDVITAVAEQTNLLALNAAIEAARAGEQGRGFAVVADEVRTLAARAESSANDIRNIVEQVQNMTSQAVQVMQSCQDACDDNVAGAKRVFDVLENISSSIQRIDDMNSQIASAAEEETAVSEEINQRIISVNEFSHKTSTGIQHTVEVTNRLNQIAEEAQQQLQQFKV